jgi:hypothetical protein
VLEVPLGDVDHSQFIELVVRNDVRPERPDDEDDEDSASQLTDAVWELAEQCWVKDPKKRPTADALCDSVAHLLEIRGSNPLLESSPAPLPISPGNSLFSLQALSISAPTSPSLSDALDSNQGPPLDGDSKVVHSAPLIDLDSNTEGFYNNNPFMVESSPPPSTTSNNNPFREFMRIVTPPADMQVVSNPVLPSDVASDQVQVGSDDKSNRPVSPAPLENHPLPPGWEERKTAGNV